MDANDTRLTVMVRDQDGVRRCGDVDEWSTIELLGSLSAGPTTLRELDAAFRRYQPHESLVEWSWIQDDRRPDGPWLAIDLLGRRAWEGSDQYLLTNPGTYQREEGPWKRDASHVWINLRPDWTYQLTDDWSQVLAVPEHHTEAWDARHILYGRPFAESVAAQAVRRAVHNELPEQFLGPEYLHRRDLFTGAERELADQWYALTVDVHAEWLMTPHEAVGGRPPRDLLHRHRDWVAREMQARCDQWTLKSTPPIPLEVDSDAYQHGPLGCHEVVMYFKFCRSAIAFAWYWLRNDSPHDPNRLTEALLEHAAWWQREELCDGGPMTCGQVIEAERRLMPLTVEESCIDDDCPLCRMEMEFDSPSFWFFDGHHLELDDHFAFSMCEDFDEWQSQRSEWLRPDLTDATETPLDASESLSAAESLETPPPDARGVWSASYISEEVKRSLIGIVFRMAEFVDRAKQETQSQQEISELNSLFDEYRRADCDAVAQRAAAIPLAQRIERLASQYPALTAMGADLQSQLDERARYQSSRLSDG